MQHFVLGCAIGALIAAAVAAPLFAPWSFRVRYLVAAPTTDPWHGLGLTPRLEMRAVRLSAFECHDGDVELVADEVDTDRTTRITLVRQGCTPALVAKLDAWMALRTPLLMITDHGHVHVYGPDGAVTNLSLAGEKVR